jgi:hypothetical protein
MLTPDEIERRLPVWVTLPALFLDTAFDKPACEYVAQNLRHPGFALRELDDILRDEVAPAFMPNLLVAGEWRGWSPDAVRDIVLGHLEKQSGTRRLPSLLRHIGRKWAMRRVAEEWDKVKAMLV